MRSIDSLRREVKKAYKELKNWRKVGQEFNITSGMAYRIAKNKYEPKDPRIRFVLGLSALAPAPVCPVHGVVHVAHRCPGQRKPRQAWMSVEEVDQRIRFVMNGGKK
jgi:hypothetical protein